jgi:hypothetical protein
MMVGMDFFVSRVFRSASPVLGWCRPFVLPVLGFLFACVGWSAFFAAVMAVKLEGEYGSFMAGWNWVWEAPVIPAFLGLGFAAVTCSAVSELKG